MHHDEKREEGEGGEKSEGGEKRILAADCSDYHNLVRNIFLLLITRENPKAKAP